MYHIFCCLTIIFDNTTICCFSDKKYTVSIQTRMTQFCFVVFFYRRSLFIIYLSIFYDIFRFFKFHWKITWSNRWAFEEKNASCDQGKKYGRLDILTSFNCLWCITWLAIAVARAGVCCCQNLYARWLRAVCGRWGGGGYIRDYTIFTVTLKKRYFRKNIKNQLIIYSNNCFCCQLQLGKK